MQFTDFIGNVKLVRLGIAWVFERVILTCEFKLRGRPQTINRQKYGGQRHGQINTEGQDNIVRPGWQRKSQKIRKRGRTASRGTTHQQFSS